MDIRTALYHGRIQHLRTVVEALGPHRIAKGMTAFEDGKSSWSDCFLARAFKDEINFTISEDPEAAIMEATGIKTRVPIRFTWTAFDSMKVSGMERAELKAMLEDIINQKNEEALKKVLDGIEFNPNVPVFVGCQSS